MAIELTVRIHRSQAVPAIPTAYIKISRIDYDRVFRSLVIHLAVFPSRDDREQIETAAAEVAHQSQALAAANATGDERAATLARHLLHIASLKVRDVEVLQPMDFQLQVPVPTNDIPACLTGGDPDTSKCYAWLSGRGGLNGKPV